MKNAYQKTCFSERSCIDFSPFSNAKSIDFSMHFQAICQASAKNTKPQKLSSRPGENTIFKVSGLKKTTKVQHKKLQNEGTKKTSKKSLQKSISGAILGSKNPPNPSKIEGKSVQNRSRKKMQKKKQKKHPLGSSWGDPGPTDGHQTRQKTRQTWSHISVDFSVELLST